jgi:hypothetical protein
MKPGQICKHARKMSFGIAPIRGNLGQARRSIWRLDDGDRVSQASGSQLDTNKHIVE